MSVYPDWVQTESEQKMHDDFRYFLWRLWMHLGLPSPTRRQLAIARYIQTCENPRRMVQAWRGAAKTWITCAYALWRLYRNPNERIKIISANEDKAVENATFMRRLIEEVPELQFLRPGHGMRDSVLAFDVNMSGASVTPSVSCAGITGQITGGRATILISDDVEVPKNSYTETMRERLAELVKEYDALVVPEGFDIIYLGTPQTEQSIYNAVRKRGYDCRIWPVRYPSLAAMAKYGDDLADDIVQDLVDNPNLVGSSVEPERFTDADLFGRELSYGKSGFALQFMLDTSLSDALKYPLKLSDMMVIDGVASWRDKAGAFVGPVSAQWASLKDTELAELGNPGFSGDRFYRPFKVAEELTAWQGSVMVIDGSGRGSDETAYAVVKHLYGTLYLTACGGFKSGYDSETLQALAHVAKDQAVNLVLVESNYGDGMFTELLKPHLQTIYPCSVEEYKVTGQKEVRIIDDLEPVLNQHRLVVDAEVIRKDIADAVENGTNYSLFYQLTHITKERGALAHEDRLEVLARGVRHFREQLARDTQLAEAEHKARLQQAEFDAFMVRAKRPVARLNFHGMPAGVSLGTQRGRFR